MSRLLPGRRGPPASLDGLSIVVEGRTLIVRAGSGGWGGYPGEGRGPVTIELGTHDLGTAWINGAGALLIDRVKGLSFDLAIQGVGSWRGSTGRGRPDASRHVRRGQHPARRQRAEDDRDRPRHLLARRPRRWP